MRVQTSIMFSVLYSVVLFIHTKQFCMCTIRFCDRVKMRLNRPVLKAPFDSPIYSWYSYYNFVFNYCLCIEYALPLDAVLFLTRNTLLQVWLRSTIQLEVQVYEVYLRYLHFFFVNNYQIIYVKNRKIDFVKGKILLMF